MENRRAGKAFPARFMGARFVKEIGRLGGDISHFVAPRVETRIVERLARARAAPGKGD